MVEQYSGQSVLHYQTTSKPNGGHDQITSWTALANRVAGSKEMSLGSGNLHRNGYNYKPVSEEMVLAQRLSQPKPGSGKSRKKKDKRMSVSHTPLVERPMPPHSLWNTAHLTSEPFWSPSSQLREHSRPMERGNNSINSKWAMKEQDTSNICLSNKSPLQPLDGQDKTTLVPEQPSGQPITPLVEINVQMAIGVTATIYLYKDSKTTAIAEEFGSKHNLIISQTAKENMARNLLKILNDTRKQLKL